MDNNITDTRIPATVHNITTGEWNVVPYRLNQFETFTLKCSFEELGQKLFDLNLVAV